MQFFEAKFNLVDALNKQKELELQKFQTRNHESKEKDEINETRGRLASFESFDPESIKIHNHPPSSIPASQNLAKEHTTAGCLGNSYLSNTIASAVGDMESDETTIRFLSILDKINEN